MAATPAKGGRGGSNPIVCAVAHFLFMLATYARI
jgi:hypothetical protein